MCLNFTIFVSVICPLHMLLESHQRWRSRIEHERDPAHFLFFAPLFNMDSPLRFTGDDDWAKGVPVFSANSDLTTRAQGAFACPSTTPATVVEEWKNHDWTLSTVPLAHYIISSILDSPPNPPHIYLAQNGTQVEILLRSELIFYRIDINVFSSSRKPLAFRPPTASCNIAFFHQTNSYHCISEFHVLASSSHMIIRLL